MITLPAKICNPISQDSYDSAVQSIQIAQLFCPGCHHAGCLTYHGSYRRFVKVGSAIVKLTVQRVKCSECGKTHALLLDFIVPYSQIPLETQVKIIEAQNDIDALCAIMAENTAVDESNIRYVIRQFRAHWAARVRSMAVALRPLQNLVEQCFSHFKRQFMQIRRTINSLFLVPT